MRRINNNNMLMPYIIRILIINLLMFAYPLTHYSAWASPQNTSLAYHLEQTHLPLIAQSTEERKTASLKVSSANLRAGPGLNYPIKGRYNQKMIPFFVSSIVGEWYKVLDYTGNSGWLHKSLLSNAKTAITTKDISKVYLRARTDSKIIFNIRKDIAVLLFGCSGIFCEISVPKTNASVVSGQFNKNKILNDITGWVRRSSLWIP